MHQPHEPIMYSRDNILKAMKFHINGSPRHVVQISTKLRNNLTFFSHTVTWIMQEIYLTGTLSYQQLITSMELSSASFTIKNSRYPKAVPMRKQEQFTQLCWIKTGLKV